MGFEDGEEEIRECVRAWASSKRKLSSSLDIIEGGKEYGQQFITINAIYKPTGTVVLRKVSENSIL